MALGLFGRRARNDSILVRVDGGGGPAGNLSAGILLGGISPGIRFDEGQRNNHYGDAAQPGPDREVMVARGDGNSDGGEFFDQAYRHWYRMDRLAEKCL